MRLHLHRYFLSFVATIIFNAIETSIAQTLQDCPIPGVDPPVVFTDTYVKIGILSTLCKLDKIKDNTIVIPVGRSYEDNDWEVSAGPYAGTTTFDCRAGDDFCTVILPALDVNETYVLTSYDYTLDKPTEVARFLEQATFGPTKDLIDNWDMTDSGYDSSFSNWIKGQMNEMVTPVSSHREFFRHHANTRLNYAYDAGAPGPKPCEVNSRWRKFAITTKDRGLTFMVRSLNADMTSAPFAVDVNGALRTITRNITFEGDGISLQLDTFYEICYDSRRYYKESAGSPLYVKLQGGDGTCYKITEGIPLVDLHSFESEALHIVNLPSIDSTDLTSIDDDDEYSSVYWDSYKSDDEFILTNIDNLITDECNKLLQDIWNPEKITFPLPPVFGKTTENGTSVYLLYDPRLELKENTIENPISDGGGQISIDNDGKVKCANAPRTPFNEHKCFLSTDDSACSAELPPTFVVQLTEEALKYFYNTTGRYVYAIDNLPLNDETKPGSTSTYLQRPCRAYATRSSRWQRMDDLTQCTGNYSIVGNETEAIFASLLEDVDGDFPYLNDVERHQSKFCDDADNNKYYLGFVKSISDGTEVCWHHVHPKHLNVYDMTPWVSDHPGGPTKITQWAEKKNSSILIFPDSHHFEGNFRFYENIVNNKNFTSLGKLNEAVPFKELPELLKTKAIEDKFGGVNGNKAKKGVVICGSLGEVASDPLLGAGFDLDHDNYPEIHQGPYVQRQRHTIWAILSLTAADQLRQRVAWALSQILVINPDDLTNPRNTETAADYYDIFVRHAFHTYKDVLKKVAFSMKMGQYLSYTRNRSYQYYKDRKQPISFPDENFAREIMQLFSIGLIKLNDDGTPQLDENGDEIQTYSDTDIISFARAWTGFDNPALRGNYEGDTARVDPMFLQMEWRDIFPKTDLDGGYIGDGKPLCVDLPDKHHLRIGATYRVLGGRVNPELQGDSKDWEDDPELVRLELDTTSELYQKLCVPSGGNCTFPGHVVLDSNLECNPGAVECKIDTIRTVRVQSLPDPIYYEYVRTPCVEQAFFNNAKKVKDWTDRKNGQLIVKNMMCADTRRDIAAESCCMPGWETSTLDVDHGYRHCKYHAERMTYATAVNRCAAYGREQCDERRIKEFQAGICAKDQSDLFYYHWTTGSCRVQVMVRDDGAIAIIHNPDPDYSNTTNVPNMVSTESNNFFKTSWSSQLHPTSTDNCASSSSCTVMDNKCLCDTTVEEFPAFTDPASLSNEAILSSIHIGAFPPEIYGTGVYNEFTCNGVTTFILSADGSSCNNLSIRTIFQVQDENGLDQYLKNMISTVKVDDTYSFRNPVHYISLVDREVRDAYYETDAVLDYYFHNRNHAPFLALRMIQRLGISSPSPRFVKAVVQAYRSGTYQSIGSGKYGDLGAMVAAILLDREARSIQLDADQTHGSLREPLVKVISAMRSLDYVHDSPLHWPLLSRLEFKIGQGSYEAPSVFSFFLPKFIPPGPLGTASLYSPEAVALNGAKQTNILQGFYSLITGGLNNCRGGFSERRPSGEGCGANDFTKNLGRLTYDPPLDTLDDVLNDLGLLLTSGRLNTENKDLIKADLESNFNFTDPVERATAIRTAQEYILTSPEFHTTNLVLKSGMSRDFTTGNTNPSAHPYKAVIFFMQSGGCDSWNMLVPNGNCLVNPNNETNLYDEYAKVRDNHAIPSADLLTLDASTSGQWCDTFGLNPELSILKQLYDEEDALFMANTGVLQRLVTQETWRSTQSSLFSHNSQQEEIQHVDIEDEFRRTGILGRMMDALKENGFSTAVAGVDSQCIACSGDPVKNNPVTGLSSEAPTAFPENSVLQKLNDATTKESGLYAETWSSRWFQSVVETEQILSVFNNDIYALDNFGQGSSFAKDLKTVARWIKARKERGVNREAFFVKQGGYDLHDTSSTSNLEARFSSLNSALTDFHNAMLNESLWENVVFISLSDFGRTLVPNSNGEARRRGTDHGWAGNYFMMGGDLNGKQILGEYPNDLTKAGPYNIGKGRGRMIPSTPWESIWNGIAQWMGVTDEADLAYVLPTRDNFPICEIYTDKQMFKSGQVDPYVCPTPTSQPSESSEPSLSPSASPSTSQDPSSSPSLSSNPSSSPTMAPSGSIDPSSTPTSSPSLSSNPSSSPTMAPSASIDPSSTPSSSPSLSSNPSSSPTMAPSGSIEPSSTPSSSPSLSSNPSSSPTMAPSGSVEPSSTPTQCSQATCRNGICEDTEDCISCPEDCQGKTNGKASTQYCCNGGPSSGGGVGPNPIFCGDSRCILDGSICNEFVACKSSPSSSPSVQPASSNPPSSGCTPDTCNDGICQEHETCISCPQDCNKKTKGGGKYCCYGGPAGSGGTVDGLSIIYCNDSRCGGEGIQCTLDTQETCGTTPEPSISTSPSSAPVVTTDPPTAPCADQNESCGKGVSCCGAFRCVKSQGQGTCKV